MTSGETEMCYVRIQATRAGVSTNRGYSCTFGNPGTMDVDWTGDLVEQAHSNGLGPIMMERDHSSGLHHW